VKERGGDREGRWEREIHTYKTNYIEKIYVCFDREGREGGRRTSSTCVRVKHTDMYGSSAMVADLFPCTNLNVAIHTCRLLTNRSCYPDFVRVNPIFASAILV